MKQGYDRVRDVHVDEAAERLRDRGLPREAVVREFTESGLGRCVAEATVAIAEQRIAETISAR